MQTPVSEQQHAALERSARACARLLARRARQPLGGGRLSRGVGFLLHALAVWARRILREHWDIGLFDAAFGSLKAFVVYPALFRSGLAWTIPVLEYAPLNTQLWTAGYLGLRGRVRSKWGEWRHGVALETLDARRAEALRAPPGGFVHAFEWDGRVFELRVVSGRLAAWWRRVRGRELEPGTIDLGELRDRLPARLVYEARCLRAHDLLYERTLVECVLRDPDPSAARQLVARARAAEPREHPFGALVKASRAATRARIRLLADRHATRVGERLPGLSWDGLALRWLGGSYQRRALRLVGEVEELEYGLLADVHRGVAWHRSPRADALRAANQRLVEWCEQLESFIARSRQAGREAGLRRRVEREIALARRLGLQVRLARVAGLPEALGIPVVVR